MRVLLFVLSNVSFLQLAGNLWQNFTGVVGEVQISDLLRRHRDNCKGLPVLLNGGTTNLQQNTSSENNKGPTIAQPTYIWRDSWNNIHVWRANQSSYIVHLWFCHRIWQTHQVGNKCLVIQRAVNLYSTLLTSIHILVSRLTINQW